MLLKILILQGTDNWKDVKTAIRIVEEQFFDVILICGVSGYREVLNLDRKVFGIPSLEDDIYIIKILKEKDSYIAGSWHQIEREICVGGVDSKNPFQNAERLRQKRPPECKYAIILSSYAPKHSSCSRVELMNREVGVGFAPLLPLAKEFSKSLVVSCSSHVEKEVCIENLEQKVLLIVTRKPITQVAVDLKALKAEVM